jgi:Ca-activated chloride channel family protein
MTMQIPRTIASLATALVLAACGSAAREDAGAAGDDGGPSVGQGGAQDFGQFRSILEAGEIPGPETLDDVGFFNEHKIELPSASCGDDVCLHGQLGVLGNMISGSNCTIVLLGMNTAIDPAELERPPLNLAIVVDASGSMAGAPIEYLREGLFRMLDDLSPEDRISLVSFSDEANVLLEAIEGDRTTDLTLAIDDIEAGGSTNIYDGLRKGYDLVAAHAEEGRQNRVILLSDGEATAGITTSSKIVAMSSAYNAAGYSLTTIGMGEEFDPELMRDLAEEGAGAFYYLEDPAAVQEVFEEEVTTFLVPLARDLRIDVNIDAGYTLRAMYGTKQYELSGNDAWIDIPIVQIAHRESASDDMNGRRGGGGAIVAELLPRSSDTVEEPGIVGRLVMSYVRVADGETIVQEVPITTALTPGEIPEGGHFDSAGVEKSFVMLNIFAGFQLASQRALWGDDRGALAVLEPLSGAVTEWLADNPDDDIADDLRYIGLFMTNLRARGAEDPAPNQNPPEPWPND